MVGRALDQGPNRKQAGAGIQVRTIGIQNSNRRVPGSTAKYPAFLFGLWNSNPVLRVCAGITCAFCCWSPGTLARRERRAYSRYVRSEQRSQRAWGPQPEGARRRAGICFVAASRRCATASPASRRLASARPALAPKCKGYSLTGPKPSEAGDFDGWTGAVIGQNLREKREDAHAKFSSRTLSGGRSCRTICQMISRSKPK